MAHFAEILVLAVKPQVLPRVVEQIKDCLLYTSRPDGKSQVSVEYDENGKPLRLEAVVLSTQHDEDVTQEPVSYTHLY